MGSKGEKLLKNVQALSDKQNYAKAIKTLNDGIRKQINSLTDTELRELVELRKTITPQVTDTEISAQSKGFLSKFMSKFSSPSKLTVEEIKDKAFQYARLDLHEKAVVEINQYLSRNIQILDDEELDALVNARIEINMSKEKRDFVRLHGNKLVSVEIKDPNAKKTPYSKEFNKIVDQANELIKQEKYEEAISVISDFMWENNRYLTMDQKTHLVIMRGNLYQKVKELDS